MPVIHTADALPAWCELSHFEIVYLDKGETHTFQKLGPKQKLLVGAGRCRIRAGNEVIDAEEGANLDLDDDVFQVLSTLEPCTLIYLVGEWGEVTGGSGLFRVEISDSPSDQGDPVDYVKNTNFDCHYHDCDEYWILYQGRGVAMTEGKHYPVAAGDCVVTGMGHHHDFPVVELPVRAVFFETTLAGQRRRGHLWNHTHGPAQPQTDRV